jgi:hypothetical protein
MTTRNFTWTFGSFGVSGPPRENRAIIFYVPIIGTLIVPVGIYDIPVDVHVTRMSGLLLDTSHALEE